jgi:4-amino-4-deoxy-L-arabinose transferase-like glycosyltransferase
MIIVYVFIVLVLLFVVIFLSQSDLLTSSVSKGKKDADGYIENVSMKISSPQWSIEYLHRNTKNVTVASFLFECATYYNFSVQNTYWKGYRSFFITGIHDIENGDNGRYWQYYVNEQFADVGCSNYYLNDNDVVEWRFEPSSWLK